MKNIPGETIKIALIIVAHDESMVIERTILSAIKALERGDDLFVIDDNSKDDTAIIAKSAGAQVFIRDTGTAQGKGKALAWFVKFHWDILRNFNRVVILDADSHIEPDFTNKIKVHLNDTNTVFQCFVYPVEYTASPISTLIALSELVEQSIFDKIRSKLGWPIRLRGTGMVISPRVLLSVSDKIRTEVEDIALSLLIADSNIKIKQLADIEVYDPKPVETKAASRQRARWFRGQWAALWRYRKATMKIIGQGPGGCLLISSIFFKPRWLMVALNIILAVACYRLPLLAVIAWSLVLIDFILYGFGIFHLKERNIFLKAIVFVPQFVLMWVIGIFLSFQRLPWLRVRESTITSETASYTGPDLIKPIKVN